MQETWFFCTRLRNDFKKNLEGFSPSSIHFALLRIWWDLCWLKLTNFKCVSRSSIVFRTESSPLNSFRFASIRWLTDLILSPCRTRCFSLLKLIAASLIDSLRKSHHSWRDGKNFRQESCERIILITFQQKTSSLRRSKFSRQIPGPWLLTFAKSTEKLTESWSEKTQG